MCSYSLMDPTATAPAPLCITMNSLSRPLCCVCGGSLSRLTPLSLALARGKGGWEKKPGGQGRRRPFWQAGITRCPRAAVRSGPDGWRGVAGGGPGCDRCRPPPPPPPGQGGGEVCDRCRRAPVRVRCAPREPPRLAPLTPLRSLVTVGLPHAVHVEPAWPPRGPRVVAWSRAGHATRATRCRLAAAMRGAHLCVARTCLLTVQGRTHACPVAVVASLQCSPRVA